MSLVYEDGYAFEKNVVILEIVNLRNITNFLDSIILTDELFNFVTDSSN